MAINRARNEFLVAWERYDGGAALTDIYGRLMTGTGQPLQPTSIEYARMTVSNTKPAVAALPTASPIGHYLVIWELRYAAGDRDIYGRTAASSSLRRTNRSWPSRAFTANFGVIETTCPPSSSHEAWRAKTIERGWRGSGGSTRTWFSP